MFEQNNTDGPSSESRSMNWPRRAPEGSVTGVKRPCLGVRTPEFANVYADLHAHDRRSTRQHWGFEHNRSRRFVLVALRRNVTMLSRVPRLLPPAK